MARTTGIPAVKIGLVDGPVSLHPDLAGENVRYIKKGWDGGCSDSHSLACQHATFVAGVLSAKRNSTAPAICPGCTLLVRPIFAEAAGGRGNVPGVNPANLAAAIIDCVNSGARIINLSLGLSLPSTPGDLAFEQAVDYAAKNGVMVAAAAGNHGMIGSSAIAVHPWLVPVVACDLLGRPMKESNLSRSIGIRGLSAPGDGVISLASTKRPVTLRGTSVAVPFVTGAIALLWSEFPSATAAQIKVALTRNPAPGRASIMPPLLDAEMAYQRLIAVRNGGQAA